MPRSARPEVSVLMPAFNCARYLTESIESVLKQDHPNFELLILDDGSKDGTWTRARRFSEDPRVRLFRSERNRGEARSRNFLLKKARGRYLVNHDADDIMLPADRLSRQQAYLDRNPGVVAVYGDSLVLDESRRPWLGTSGIDLRGQEGHALPDAYHCSAMYRASLARRAGGYDARFEVGTDVDMWLKWTAAGPCRYLPGATFAYRAHPTSLSLRQRRRIHGAYELAFREAARRRLAERTWTRRYEVAGLRALVRTNSHALVSALDKILVEGHGRGRRAQFRFDLCSSEGVDGLFRHAAFPPEKGGLVFSVPDPEGPLYARSLRYGLAMRVSRTERQALVFFDSRRRWERPDDLMEFTFMLPLVYLLRPRGWHFLHAAALARRGRAVLFEGPSYSGKTTLSLDLLGKGWSLLSDETTLLKARESGFEVRGFPRHLQVKPMTLRRHPMLRGLRDLENGGGGRRIFRAPGRSGGGARLTAMLLLRYRKGARFRLTRLGAVRAERALRSQRDLALAFGPEASAEMDRLLLARRLAASGRMYRCEYSDKDRRKVMEIAERLVEGDG